MIPPDDDTDENDERDGDPADDETGDAVPDDADDDRDTWDGGSGSGAVDDDDEPEGDGSEESRESEEPEPGYLWTFTEQEERLPDEYPLHMDILDEMEAREVLDLDLAHAGDYVLWAAAQSLEEQGWVNQAIDLLRRLAASSSAHPALSYPEIRLRLHDLLRERGDYDEALAILDMVERQDPERRETCRERRAEVLVLTGRSDEGLRLFEAAARAIPDDPWVPLAAAWALIRAGEYDEALPWVARAERAARRLEDEQEIRAVDAEVERLQNEARIRRERQQRLAAQAEARARAEAGAEAGAGEGAEAPGGDAPAPDAGSSAPAGGPRGAETPEAGARARGEEAPGPDAAAPRAVDREAILAELDAEEVRLTRTPPRSEKERDAAIARLVILHRRASAAWDDAVERHDEQAIAAFDDLQWEIVEVAERFGLKIPGTEDS